MVQDRRQHPPPPWRRWQPTWRRLRRVEGSPGRGSGVSEAPAARAFRIRQYEEFFNHSGLATSDDNLMYAFCQDVYAAAAGRMPSQGYARGLAPAGERRYCGDELGLGSPAWTYGNREYGDETCFHAGHREWLRLMSREETP